MKHAVKHSLDDATARRACEAAWQSYSTRFAEYKPQADWVTDKRCNIQFSVKGATLKGVLGIVPGAIELELDVPFLFRPFKKKAIDVIEREIKVWVNKAERGEL